MDNSMYHPNQDKGTNLVTKMLLVMKFTAFFLLAACLQVSAGGYTQTVTLSLKDVSLEQAFKAVEKQSGYTFVYARPQLEHTRRVDLFVKEVGIEEVLGIIFKNQPVGYTISKKFIVVKSREVEVSTSLIPMLPIDVKGRVTNENGDPIIGVTVTVKGSRQATSTNGQGEFSIGNTDKNAVLVFSGANVETFEYHVAGQADLLVKLTTKINRLDEVQVIAYGTTTRRLNTGNVTSVKAVDIEKQPVNNPLLALQGRVPGIEITQSTGLPGSGVTVHIRGQNSLQNGNDPLYIIDGVPYFSQNIVTGLNLILGNSGTSAGGSPLSNINPADIESIDILKDADATAIYGSRGANGVVLITTKKGNAGQMKVDANMQSGWGKVAKKLDLLKTQQYLEMRHDAFRNDGSTTVSPTDYDLTLWDTTRNTDWQKELIGGTSHYNDIQVSMSGGNTNSQYMVSGGFHKETSPFPGTLADQKSSLHFSINSASSNQRLRLLLSGNYLIDNNRLIVSDLTQLAITMAPNAPSLYKPNGSLNWAPDATGVGTWTNPFAYLFAKFHNRINNLIGNAVLSYKILPGLEIKSSFGYTNTQNDQSNTFPSSTVDPSQWRSYGTDLRSARFAATNIRSWIIEPQVTYIKNIRKGTLTALIGTTIQQSNTNGLSVDASGYNSDLVLDDVTSASIVYDYSINSVYKYNALFGRINYNYDDKYLINVTSRRDGTSRFGPAKQFANFYALGTGWVFSKEKYIQNNFHFFSFGKLRASYGTTGSDQVGDYRFMDLYSPVSVGVPYQDVIGVRPTRLFTPDLAWEATKKAEAGLELGFFKDRVLITASYYHNRSSNQLTNYTLPYITGFSSINRNLDALVQNTGWEFLLNSINVQSKKVLWSSSFNLTLNRNRLISIASGMSASYQRIVGLPLSTQFMYHYIGVDPATGLYQFDDGHGSGTDQPDTSYLLSTHPINSFPKFYGGFQSSISFGGIQLDLLFQFVKQIGSNYLFNTTPGEFVSGTNNQPVLVLSRWQKPGDITNTQRFSQDGSLSNLNLIAQSSDLVQTDASYIRLKNLSLSWQLPEQWKKKAHFQGCRIYIHGQNLLTFTKYKGMDPETLSTTSLPPLRVVTIGVQISL